MTLRVCQLIQYFQVGGIERMVLSLARQARERGVETIVAAYIGDGSFRAHFERAGIRTAFFETPRGVPYGLPLTLTRFLVQERVDVLHSHHLGPLIYGGLGAALAGIGHVHTEHSLELYDHWRRRAAAKLMSSRADVVAVTDSLAQRRETTLGCSARVIPNGVSLPVAPTIDRRQSARMAWRLPLDVPVIGCVARLSPEKDHKTLIAAFALAASQTRCHLVLAGDGQLAAEIESDIKARGLAHRVHMLGRVDDIESLYPALDVISLSSRREGLPLALLEGMAYGAVPVATAVGGTRDLLSTGVGQLVPPSDPGALARAWMKTIGDRRRLPKTAEAARSLVRSAHSDEAMTTAYIARYQQQLPSHRRRR